MQTEVAREFQVDYTHISDLYTHGQIGEEGSPSGMTLEEYHNSPKYKEGKRYLRFQRPFQQFPNFEPGPVLTDEENGMWVPRNLLKPGVIM